MSSSKDWDAIVIGGGMVGMAVAYGLAKQGERVGALALYPAFTVAGTFI